MNTMHSLFAILFIFSSGCLGIVSNDRDTIEIDFQDCDHISVVLFPFPELDSNIKESTVPFRVPNEDMKLISKLSGTYKSIAPHRTFKPIAECILHRDNNPVILTIYWQSQTPLIVSINGNFYMRRELHPDESITDEPTEFYQYVYFMIQPNANGLDAKSDPRRHLERIIP